MEIPLEHYDFSYVEKCNDKHEIRKILKKLRSGDLGKFDVLEKTVEEKLRKLDPQCRLLRKSTHLKSTKYVDNESEINLQNFLNEMDNIEEDYGKSSAEHTEKNIRCGIDAKRKKEKKVSKKKVKSYDEWNTVVNDLCRDIEVEEIQENLGMRNLLMDTELENKSKTVVEEPVEINGTFSNDLSKKFSNDERIKGNEYFNEKNYEKAIFHYRKGVNFYETVDLLNNLAITYIFSEQYDKAETICNNILKNFDGKNFKAKYRLALTLSKQNRHQRALAVIRETHEDGQICPESKKLERELLNVISKGKKVNIVKSQMDNEESKKQISNEQYCIFEEIDSDDDVE
ncbi:hypothetical protein SNEBB_009927 [Seison nebaliae]|nr:hypothetical protein SNEBB_009927 [Seison nebaliae]